MGIEFSLFTGKVMHKRLAPKENGFVYDAFFVAIPLKKLDELPIAYNRFGVTSFYDADHGPRDGSTLYEWAQDILKSHKVKNVKDITLITTPRYLGYGFNPISYWLCYDTEDNIRAILCEVHNTFGEDHTYICVPQEGNVIDDTTLTTTEKVFHVSPFMHRHGRYDFRFKISDPYFASWIDYFAEDNTKLLATSLMGQLRPWTRVSYHKFLWAYPFNSLKTIGLIHWQALKLALKGLKYISKPTQKETRVSVAKQRRK